MSKPAQGKRLPQHKGNGFPDFIISDEDRDLIYNSINEKFKHGPNSGRCEVCGFDDWVIDDELVTTTTFDFVNDCHLHNRVCLLASFSCENCGNTKFFTLDHLGITTKGGLEGG